VTLALESSSSPRLLEMWLEADDAARRTRGGAPLLDTIRRGAGDEVLEHLIALHCLYAERDGSELRGLAVVRERVVEAIYVAPAFRRRGVARSMIASLQLLSDPPLDGWALPGDRATKSLYEAVGWKARLLTMRAG
jgi:GNAT superfamily N-acetyltransferase